MRCPKCGFHSFDHLETCKKCGQDLSEHKVKYGIGGLMTFVTASRGGAAPKEAKEGPAADEVVAEVRESVESPTDDLDFGFGLMDDEATEPAAGAAPEPLASDNEDDFFQFDETPSGMSEATDSAAPLAREEEAADDFFQVDEDFAAMSEAAEPAAPLTPKEEAADDFAEDDLDALDLDDLVSFDGEADQDPEYKKDSDPFEVPEPVSPQPAPEFDEEAAPSLPPSWRNKYPSLAAFDDGESWDGEVEDDGAPLDFSDVSIKADAAVATQRWDSADDDGFAVEEDAASTDWVTTPMPEPEPETADRYPASVTRRVLAGACDVTLLLLVAAAFVVAGQVVAGRAGWPGADTFLQLAVPYFLIIFCLSFAYFTGCHFLWGETPGKMFFGVRVQTVTGSSLDLSQAFLRTVGGLMSLLLLGFGYLAALFDRDRRGWNDRLAGTLVVDSRQENPLAEAEG